MQYAVGGTLDDDAVVVFTLLYPPLVCLTVGRILTTPILVEDQSPICATRQQEKQARLREGQANPTRHGIVVAASHADPERLFSGARQSSYRTGSDNVPFLFAFPDNGYLISVRQALHQPVDVCLWKRLRTRHICRPVTNPDAIVGAHMHQQRPHIRRV